MLPLQQLALVTDAFADQHTVGYIDKAAFSWQQLQQRCAAWQAVLQPHSAQHIALYHSDTLEFAAALLALWRLGKIPVLPASPRVDEALREQCQVFAGQFVEADNVSPGEQRLSLDECNSLGETTTALVVFTSGSSGKPVAISKSFRQLNSELMTWERLHGTTLQQAVVTGTVSHQHIYGLLFRVLWPLCAGRPIVQRARDYWEDIFLDAQHYEQLVLVTSPAHLDRMPPLQHAAAQWQRLAGVCRWVVSSGAPLSLESAGGAAERLQQDVTEVYGSSETGGVAWRQQRIQAQWQCLPQVEIQTISGDSATGDGSSETLLQIRSPHLPDTQWFTTADRCEVSLQQGVQQFLLLGRSDRLVKLAGKRISLTAIEQRLCDHPLVRQCRVISLPEKQDRLGAVLCLSDAGNQQLVDSDRATLSRQLRDFLEQQSASANLERIALPRYWRFLSDLPRNNQGKVTQASLLSLFSDELAYFPEVVAQSQKGKTSVELQLFIPMNLYYFQGHFPGTPILPGVVQTHWAIHYGREFFPLQTHFSQLEAVKFQQVIRPHEVVTLRLDYNTDKDKLVFSYTSQSGEQTRQHSSGRVVFVASEPADG